MFLDHKYLKSKKTQKAYLVIIVSLVLFVGFNFAPHEIIVDKIDVLQFWATEHYLFSLTSLFLWSFLIFLTVAPLGSFTILLAGFLLGPVAGFIQFLSLCFSSWVIFEWTQLEDAEQSLKAYERRNLVSKIIQQFRGRPLMTVLALRLIPVIPSCACVMISTALHISGKDLLRGTIAVGWVRPVILAIAGSQAHRVTDVVQGFI